MQQKSYFKRGTAIDSLKFAKKDDLPSLKSDVDKLDIDKLLNVSNDLNSLKSKADKLDFDKFKTAPVDLKKLSDIVDKDGPKKSKYHTVKIVLDKENRC